MHSCLLAVANGDQVHLVCPEVYSREVNQATREMFAETKKAYELNVAADKTKE